MPSQPDPAEITAIADRIAPPDHGRRLVAVAGPPGSGKSTLAAALVETLGARDIAARAVPMDGFHLDNALLAQRGLTDRKGAPESFDADGFVHAMERLAAGGEVVLPAFDRSRDLAVAGRIVVEPATPIVIVEGNYLCLAAPPWNRLAALWDELVFLAPPIDVLEARLLKRWRDLGLSEDAVMRKVHGNDLPNARLVLDQAPGTGRTLRNAG